MITEETKEKIRVQLVVLRQQVLREHILLKHKIKELWESEDAELEYMVRLPECQNNDTKLLEQIIVELDDGRKFKAKAI